MQRPFSLRIVSIFLVLACTIIVGAFLIRPIINIVADYILSRPTFQRNWQKSVDLTRLHLEVATTNAERQLGLGGRTSMADDAGMLFLYDKPGVYPFWMKGMHFPLDIIWINGDRVVDIVTLQSPVSEGDAPATHVPLRLADTVLEINAGVAKKLGIESGVKIVLPQ